MISQLILYEIYHDIHYDILRFVMPCPLCLSSIKYIEELWAIGCQLQGRGGIIFWLDAVFKFRVILEVENAACLHEITIQLGSLHAITEHV